MSTPALTLEAPSVAAEQRIAVATQWQLMWWRFRKHKLALGGTVVLVLFYVVALFADFFAYAEPHESDAQRSLIAPQTKAIARLNRCWIARDTGCIRPARRSSW